MPLRLFRSRNVAGANVVQALLVVGMFGMFFLGALYLQRILGYDALQVGLAFLPADRRHGHDVASASRGSLTLRFGPQATLVPAMVFIVVGLLLLARTPVDATYAIDLLPAMILIGLGAGLGFPSLMKLAMSGATETDSGSPRDSSTPASRSAARSASRCWRPSRRSAPTRCSPTANRRPRRSTPATTSPT